MNAPLLWTKAISADGVQIFDIEGECTAVPKAQLFEIKLEVWHCVAPPTLSTAWAAIRHFIRLRLIQVSRVCIQDLQIVR